MKIDVLQEDIDNGLPRSICGCPVALRLQQVFPGSIIQVDGGDISINDKRHKQPASVRRFIRNFDFPGEYDIAEPFSFELPVDG